MSSRTYPQVAIRLPPDVKAFIKAEAVDNASSQNSEIVRAIRAQMKARGIGDDGTSLQQGELDGRND